MTRSAKGRLSCGEIVQQGSFEPLPEKVVKELGELDRVARAHGRKFGHAGPVADTKASGGMKRNGQFQLGGDAPQDYAPREASWHEDRYSECRLACETHEWLSYFLPHIL
jgi:hypothetical protein